MFKAIRNAVIDRVLATNTGRKAAMRAATAMGNGIVYRNLGDHKLVVDSSELIGRTVLKTGNFSRDILDGAVSFLAGLDRLPADAIFVDVGANIGTHSVYASLTGRFSELVCIEPDPANFELLAANIALNGLTTRARLLNTGAGERNGELHLYRVSENGGASTLVAPKRGIATAPITVTVRRLDDLLAEHSIARDRIGLVWIDTEGFEPSVWSGMPRLLQGRPNVVLEFSPRLYGPSATHAFCNAMAALYDEVRLIGSDGLSDCSWTALAEQTDQVDVLLTAARHSAK